MKLTGKNVVIVGGSEGIGFAVAKIAKENGANVIIAGRSAEKLERAAAQLGDVKTFVADYTDETVVNNLFVKLERVDHVYIAAGAFVGGTILEGKIEDFQSSFARIWGNTFVVRAAAPKMVKGGSFVFTGGVSTARPAAGEQ
jgi:NADP-dependent 3-hydroxy acid dehydrogenase YdfG